MRHKFLCILSAFVLALICVSSVRAYGPEGHKAIGAIADEILKNEPVLAKLTMLLHGMKLADAALLPDRIKEWDGKPLNQHNLDGVPDEVVKDLRAFWKANQAKVHGDMRHHAFHYTDISVESDLKYSPEKTGASDTDVVHMISFCIEVLKDPQPEENEFKITKTVAAVLLAHYVGDIHQPLHVGAEYFDHQGNPVDPDLTPAQADQGGNKIRVTLNPNVQFPKLHGLWDSNCVVEAFGSPHPTADQIREMATQQPAGWEPLPDDNKTWSIAWANEILPLAKEAHTRLKFSNIQFGTHGEIRSGNAVEIDPNGGYLKWAGEKTREEIQKAGWRLAEIFKKVL